LAVYDDGNGQALYVAGNFGSAGGQPISRIAKWDGTNWSALGSGIDGMVQSMVVADDGSGTKKLLVAGSMTIAGGIPVSKLAIWDGAAWSAFPVNPLGYAAAMHEFDDGRGPALFFGGDAMAGGVQTHYISRWDGTNWTALGDGILGSGAWCMAEYDYGSGHGPDLYVGGLFVGVGGDVSARHLARWIRCAGPIDSFCPGDGTLSHCPCTNYGQVGHGCENSAATGGAMMTSFGTTSPDTLRFVSTGELANSLSILLQGNAPTLSVFAFGDGLRCTGGHLLRLFVTNASNGAANVPGQGNPSISARSAALGDPLSPGAIRLYQVYYRDPISTCGGFFNASNGARIVW
jgi:hypothetical protein